ncbi:MAG: hypothetical protein L3J20_06420 [Flavobacteriaceae bacterium]|nr:hypothetical protein [Flavobacteriaceae bacterium]
MNDKICYPVFFIHHNTLDINARKLKEMVADIRFLNDKEHEKKYHTNVQIIDSKGSIFYLKRMRQIGKVNIWLSILYSGKIVKVEPIVDCKNEHISLPELKILIMDIIKKKTRKWLPLGPLNVVQELVDEANSYIEIMHIFNTKIK